MHYRLMALFIVFAMAACAQTVNWEHSTAPKERWGVDQSTCKRFASREAEREYAKQERLSGTNYLGQTATHESRMAVYEVKKVATRVFEACMARKGYTKAKAGK